MAHFLGMEKYTTNPDSVLDHGRVDMGYHYDPNVVFDLSIISEYEFIKPGEEFGLALHFSTAPIENVVDLYFQMVNPNGEIFYGLGWREKIEPAISGLALAPNIDILLEPLLIFNVPSDSPPISEPGTYQFMIYATLPGTDLPISNTGFADFIAW